MENMKQEKIVRRIMGRKYDEGYDSAASEDKSEPEIELELESLCILDEREEQSVVYILYNAKGLADNRYCPYSRPSVRPPQNGSRVLPFLRVLRQGDTEPSQLEVNLKWENNNELRISKTLLPQDVQLCESEGKIQIFVQFDTNSGMKCFLADVRSDTNPDDNSVFRSIGPVVLFLKAQISESQEERLLASTSHEERNAAFNLVEKKDLHQLMSGLPPHDDTVLSVLCAQKSPVSRTQTNAQIYAVVQRLLKQQEGREIILKVNKNGISALEIAAITNNHLVASYLVEVIYNLMEDQDAALDILNFKDSQENTILHLLARKGDTNINTLRSLLSLRLTDGRPVFRMLANLKKQFPIHIACQSRTNQPETLMALHQRREDEDCFQMTDSDGMTGLHHACQRTNDLQLVTTILSYRKDNINSQNELGLTALDLVSRRGQVTEPRLGLFPIDASVQDNIIKLLKNNGARHAVSMGSLSGSTSDHLLSYEDRIASQVLEEFPEMSSLLERIIDQNQN